jgi:hypothetical protein
MLRRAILLAIASLPLLVSCGGSAEAEDPGLLAGRVWFEKRPERADEHIQVFFAAKRPARGAFARASSYEGKYELFEYERDKGKVKLVFPQTGRKAGFDFTIVACDVDPFDLCLELTENPWSGPKKYYGIKETDTDDLPPELAAAAKRAIAAAE